MFNTTLTVEQRIEKAVGKLLREPRYTPLAGVLMIGKRTVSDTVPTACTNGRDEMYGRGFVTGISDAELRGVIVHETKHKMYRHLTTWRHLAKQNAMLANMAMDYVINLEIVDENPDGFCTLPAGCCLDEKYRGMNTQQVFDLLKKEGEGGQGGQGGEGGQGSIDQHDWDGAKEMTEAEARELEQAIDSAIRQGAIAASKMGIDANRIFGNLLEVQVNWREVLREFIKDTCAGRDYSTWRRPNRRFMGAGVYMPSSISERVDELVIAVDTSGSISVPDLNAFMTEVVGICDVVKPERIRLLYWGHQIASEEVYEQDTLQDLIKTTKPKGGGGTDVNCVCKHIDDKGIKAQAVIVLTDGYLGGSWGTWTMPVMWVVLNNKDASPNCGKVLHIKSGEIA